MTRLGEQSERRWLMEVASVTGTEREELRPGSEQELVGYLDIETGLVPVSGGRSGTLLPESGSRWLNLDALPSSVDIDPLSSTATVRGDIDWEALEDAASAHGLTSHLLAGAAAGRGVLSTLARSPLLPPLWLTPVPHARCTGLRAVDRDGVVYEAVAAPRTASGPDFRWLYLGAEGRHGIILSATITLDQRRLVKGFSGRTVALLDAIRDLLQVAPHRVRAAGLHGKPDSTLLLIAGEGHEARHLAERARAAGLVDVDRLPAGPAAPGPRGGEKCWLVTAPWSIATGMFATRGVRLICATGTHCTVAVPLRAGKRAQQHVAAVQRALDEWPELVRAIPHGFCPSGPRGQGALLGRAEVDGGRGAALGGAR